MALTGIPFDTINAIANVATAIIVYVATRHLRDALADLRAQLRRREDDSPPT